MHNNKINFTILSLVSKEFTNSLEELKDNLRFNLIYCDDDLNNFSSLKYDGILVDDNIVNNSYLLQSINENIDKNVIYVKDNKTINNINYNEIIIKPININDLNHKVVSLITKKNFLKNSSLVIKNYVLDKNEKKLKNNNLSIIITEKEIQLIELLFYEKNPMPKKLILKSVWKYASDADTHTVETHIYRLRKKILDKFKDNSFIINNKEGYTI
ncbi:helix-turn-helix domain-containing protein [Pelagibacteraceae bacterium]|nr:helix-turn-helix domain-containing protein [Pelagibacteraceae bacterium]